MYIHVYIYEKNEYKQSQITNAVLEEPGRHQMGFCFWHQFHTVLLRSSEALPQIPHDEPWLCHLILIIITNGLFPFVLHVCMKLLTSAFHSALWP